MLSYQTDYLLSRAVKLSYLLTCIRLLTYICWSSPHWLSKV